MLASFIGTADLLSSSWSQTLLLRIPSEKVVRNNLLVLESTVEAVLQTLDSLVWTAAGPAKGSAAEWMWMLKSASQGCYRPSQPHSFFLNNVSGLICFCTSGAVDVLFYVPSGCEQEARSFLPSGKVELGRELPYQGGAAFICCCPSAHDRGWLDFLAAEL